MANYKYAILLCIWLFSDHIIHVILGDVLASDNDIKVRNARLFSSKFLRKFHRISRRSTVKLNCSMYERNYTSGNSTDNRTKIHIGLLLPFHLANHGKEYSRGGARFYSEAFNIALDNINNDPYLLPGHKLDFVFNDTRCNEMDSIKSMYYQYVRRDKVKLPFHGFIGLGCQCGTAAKFASAMKIPVVSHVSMLFINSFKTSNYSINVIEYNLISTKVILLTFFYTKLFHREIMSISSIINFDLLKLPPNTLLSIFIEQ